MSTVRDNLIAARALIDTPEKWGKYQPSYDRWRSDEAFPLCAAGACARSTGRDINRFDPMRPDEIDALTAALPAGFNTVAAFNDARETSHPDIIALFDRAIAAQAETP